MGRRRRGVAPARPRALRSLPKAGRRSVCAGKTSFFGEMRLSGKHPTRAGLRPSSVASNTCVNGDGNAKLNRSSRVELAPGDDRSPILRARHPDRSPIGERSWVWRQPAGSWRPNRRRPSSPALPTPPGSGPRRAPGRRATRPIPTTAAEIPMTRLSAAAIPSR